ncbi:S1 family peptidase [Vibrio sp. WXL210]|uniref:S1 family peptidase n=1 Tax=Vibrio sp. WXL210 TaxID=3450709 RepID=UPI003EC880E4
MKQQFYWLPAFLGLGLTGPFALAESVPFEAPQARIISGEDAPNNAYPYIGALIVNGLSANRGLRCGSSYLGGRYVLTAAHCVDDVSADQVDVLFGVNDLDREAEGTRVSVVNIYLHESFNASRLLNDIAVLELERNLLPSEATPTTLSNQGRLNELYMNGDVTLTVAGWGTTTPEGPSVLPDTLQQVDVKLVSLQECRNVFGSVPEQNFCAGTPTEGDDSCRGDSGGPIVVKATGEQLGWVSWGDERCGRVGTYGVYADVGYFEDWLSRFRTGLSYTQSEHLGFQSLSSLGHTFEFSNIGSSVVEFDQFNLSSDGEGQASITENTCDTFGSLQVGESCQVVARFEIDTLRQYQNELTINYQSNGESFSIASAVSYEGVVVAEQALKDSVGQLGEQVYVNDNPWQAIENGMRSALIDDAEESVVVLDGLPMGYLSFDVDISSELNVDELSIDVNDFEQSLLSGTQQTRLELDLPRESNSVRFAYVKDASGAVGDDRAAVTNITWSRTSSSSSGSSSGGGGGGGAINYWWVMLLGFPALRRIRDWRNKK